MLLAWKCIRIKANKRMTCSNNNINMFNNKLSVYIPRITNEWAEETKIAGVFHTNELGLVERVDLVHKQTPEGTNYYEGFVHMDWFDTQSTRNIQSRIMDPMRDARLVHEDPNYWLLLENKNPMTATEVRLEKRIVELEERSKYATQVALNHLNRMMAVETQVNVLQHQFNNMNYWNDPALHTWRASASQNNFGIAPMWCHPVNEATPTHTPSWYGDEQVGHIKTMESYASDAENFQTDEYYEHDDSVCDYYDYDPYDMEIIE